MPARRPGKRPARTAGMGNAAQVQDEEVEGADEARGFMGTLVVSGGLDGVVDSDGVVDEDEVDGGCDDDGCRSFWSLFMRHVSFPDSPSHE